MSRIVYFTSSLVVLDFPVVYFCWNGVVIWLLCLSLGLLRLISRSLVCYVMESGTRQSVTYCAVLLVGIISSPWWPVGQLHLAWNKPSLELSSEKPGCHHEKSRVTTRYIQIGEISSKFVWNELNNINRVSTYFFFSFHVFYVRCLIYNTTHCSVLMSYPPISWFCNHTSSSYCSNPPYSPRRKET